MGRIKKMFETVLCNPEGNISLHWDAGDIIVLRVALIELEKLESDVEKILEMIAETDTGNPCCLECVCKPHDTEELRDRIEKLLSSDVGKKLIKDDTQIQNLIKEDSKP